MALIVNDVLPTVQYTATASQTTFAYPFAIFADADLKVYQVAAAGTPNDTDDILTLTTHYTVTGAGTTAGGNVVLVTGATVGDIITIKRDIAMERTTDYQNLGDLASTSFNDDLDKLVMMAQQNEEAFGRSISLVESTQTPTTFNIDDPVAEYYAVAKADLSGIKWLQLLSAGDLSVSAFAQTYLDDTTAAATLITLGLTATAAELNILDGVTATAAELNILDGVTATAAELNYVDGVTSAIQTQLDSKAPSFRGALVYLDADQTITTATNTFLAFDQEVYDTGSIHDNATNNSRLTVPAGVTKVRLTAQDKWPSNATGSRELSLLKNNSTTYYGYATDFGPALSDIHYQHIASAVIDVSAADYFELRVYQSSGGNLAVSGSALGGPLTWFAMEIIE